MFLENRVEPKKEALTFENESDDLIKEVPNNENIQYESTISIEDRSNQVFDETIGDSGSRRGRIE